jgi:hypothetical protein
MSTRLNTRTKGLRAFRDFREEPRPFIDAKDMYYTPDNRCR